jgi:hypothetical protein
MNVDGRRFNVSGILCCQYNNIYASKLVFCADDESLTES